jgi:hypothetical protein
VTTSSTAPKRTALGATHQAQPHACTYVLQQLHVELQSFERVLALQQPAHMMFTAEVDSTVQLYAVTQQMHITSPRQCTFTSSNQQLQKRRHDYTTAR